MNSIGRARAEAHKRAQAYPKPAYIEVHIWREPPIALDEWLAEVSDAREWDRHSVRVGRNPSNGEAILLKPIPDGPYTLWLGHSSRELIPFEFLREGEIRILADAETLKKVMEVAGRLRAHVGNRKRDPILDRHIRMLA